MNTGMTITYIGELRCEATHIKSGNKLITDAPPDNHGKGEAFSPTDLLCTSLACCMTTLMGIVANEKGITLGKIDADIEKIMASDPRRVVKITIDLKLENKNFTDRDKAILERTALTCPVAKSLHPEIEQNITFTYV